MSEMPTPEPRGGVECKWEHWWPEMYTAEGGLHFNTKIQS